MNFPTILLAVMTCLIFGCASTAGTPKVGDGSLETQEPNEARGGDLDGASMLAATADVSQCYLARRHLRVEDNLNYYKKVVSPAKTSLTLIRRTRELIQSLQPDGTFQSHQIQSKINQNVEFIMASDVLFDRRQRDLSEALKLQAQFFERLNKSLVHLMTAKSQYRQESEVVSKFLDTMVGIDQTAAQLFLSHVRIITEIGELEAGKSPDLVTTNVDKYLVKQENAAESLMKSTTHDEAFKKFYETKMSNDLPDTIFEYITRYNNFIEAKEAYSQPSQSLRELVTMIEINLEESFEELSYKRITNWVSMLEDVDLTNTCTQDCAGEWGGKATVNRCGLCTSGSATGCDAD